MTNRYRNKYRIASARHPAWDYGWNAAYFVTICTKDRVCWFGDVVNGEMRPSQIGEIVQSEWVKTPKIRPDMNLELGAFVVMPNHFHGIIIIGENEYNDQGRDAMQGRDTMHCVSTQPADKPRNKFGPQSKNLASIIRGFKIGVTKNARINTQEFAWQSRYHDHIIRNEKSFHTISNYIMDNPMKWTEDKFYAPRHD
ncbi:transposase [Negadavirga shengliensis]|uniref:Transposase n=1 Tax=Negadavirga shengliensis TaxID=1389218 RepID=A0ABV9T7I7_9BACT